MHLKNYFLFAVIAFCNFIFSLCIVYSLTYIFSILLTVDVAMKTCVL